MMKDPRDVILAPVVSEKSYDLIEKNNTYTFEVAPEANKTEIKEAVQKIFGVRALLGEHDEPQGEGEADRLGDWPPQEHQAGSGQARPGRLDRPVWSLRWQSRSASRLPRPPVPDGLGLRRDHQVRAGEVAHRQEEVDGGRNAYGRATSRHRGGGHKRRYRIVDFRRDKDGIGQGRQHRVRPQPQCPHRPLNYADGEKRILAPVGVKVGDVPESGPRAEIRPGNALPLRNIPGGTVVHAIEPAPAAGQSWRELPDRRSSSCPRRTRWPLLRLPSGRWRMVPLDCRATVGQVGNTEAELIKLGNGRPEPLEGVRPQTRGVAMNPVDHPLGGGEGKTSDVTRSARGASRVPTRKKNKASNKYIVRRRTKKVGGDLRWRAV